MVSIRLVSISISIKVESGSTGYAAGTRTVQTVLLTGCVRVGGAVVNTAVCVCVFPAERARERKSPLNS